MYLSQVGRSIQCISCCAALAVGACTEAQLPISGPPEHSAAALSTVEDSAAPAGRSSHKPSAGPPDTVSQQHGPMGVSEASGASRLYPQFAGRKDELVRAREALVQYAEKTGRSNSVVLSLEVLDAMLAPSESAYRQRMLRLPVTISRHQARDQLGREGTVTEYWVNGRKSGSRFDLGVHESPSSAEQSAIGSQEGGPSAHSPDFAGTPEAECSYTNQDGTWAGECATQQDIDDGWVQLAAISSDLGTMQTTNTNDVYYCQTVLNSCWETEAAPALDVGYSFGGPSAYAGDGVGPCAPGNEDCTNKAVAATGAAVAAVVRVSLAGAALSWAGVSAVALAGTTGLALGSLAIFGIYAYQLYSCVYAT